MGTKPIDTLDMQGKFLIILENCLGVVSDACSKASISRQTYYNWCELFPEFKDKVDEIKELALDFAESKMFELIKGAEIPEDKIFCAKGKIVIQPTIRRYPPDNSTIQFFLKTKGKKRGYIEKTEIDHTSGGKAFNPIQFTPDDSKNDPM